MYTPSIGLSPEAREERNRKARERYRDSRENATPEQLRLDALYSTVKSRRRRAALSEQERQEHLVRRREYDKKRRENETPEQREKRLESKRKYRQKVKALKLARDRGMR